MSIRIMPPDWGAPREWRRAVDRTVRLHGLNPELEELQAIRKSPMNYYGPPYNFRHPQELLDQLNPNHHVHPSSDGVLRLSWTIDSVLSVQLLVNRYLPNAQFDRITADEAGVHLHYQDHELATIMSGAIDPLQALIAGDYHSYQVACAIIEGITGLDTGWEGLCEATAIVAERLNDGDWTAHEFTLWDVVDV